MRFLWWGFFTIIKIINSVIFSFAVGSLEMARTASTHKVWLDIEFFFYAFITFGRIQFLLSYIINWILTVSISKSQSIDKTQVKLPIECANSDLCKLITEGPHIMNNEYIIHFN